MKATNIFVATFLLVTTVTISARSQTSAPALAEGRSLYANYCANCHGDKAQGATKAGFDISIITERGGKQPPDLTDQVWDYGSTDSEIFKVIKEGKPAAMMPAFQGSLSDAQINNIINYVHSIKPANGAAKVEPQQSNNPNKPDHARTLELVDYMELPITGDMSTDRVSGVLARGSILRDEPGGGSRFFINDLTGPLYIFDKQTKKLTTYLNFDGLGERTGLFPKFTATMGYAAGIMNFVFDPDYARNGIFYTLHMEDSNTPVDSAVPKSGVVPGLDLTGYTNTKALTPPIAPNPGAIREMVLIEWTDKQIDNTTFEGTAREILRMQLPGIFHPLNEIIFNPSALKDCFVFGDVTTGRIWYTPIKDVLAADDGNPLTVAPIYELSTQIRKLSEDTYRKRGGLNSGLPGRGAISGPGRIDLRLAEDNDGELYVLTKGDGMIRKFVNVE